LHFDFDRLIRVVIILDGCKNLKVNPTIAQFVRRKVLPFFAQHTVRVLDHLYEVIKVANVLSDDSHTGLVRYLSPRIFIVLHEGLLDEARYVLRSALNMTLQMSACGLSLYSHLDHLRGTHEPLTLTNEPVPCRLKRHGRPSLH